MIFAFTMAFMLAIELISPSIKPPEVYLTPVSVYVDRYYVKKKEYGLPSTRSRVPVSLAPLSPVLLGVCYSVLGLHNVEINQRFYESASDGEREELVFHELGHCDMDRAHVEGSIYYKGFWITKTIMHCCGMINGFEYERFHDYYMDELFDDKHALKE